VLHALTECLNDTLDLRPSDRVLAIVPMFHANAWGLPYACGLIGVSQVMPGRFLQPEPLAELIEREQVTFAAAVPTIWTGLMRHVPGNSARTASLRRVVCGGAPVSRALMEQADQHMGVTFIQGYGLTETSPLVAATANPPGTEGEGKWAFRARTGKVSPLVEVRIVDQDGAEVAWDGESTGELELRGPWVASGYYNEPEATSEKFHDGWLRTGDIASVTPLGYIQISDRTKDVIKSGGEWISSVDLENALMTHPDVVEAAVIAKPDDQWTERPFGCVVLGPGAKVSAEDLHEHLRPLVAKWWIPDEFAVVGEIPKTSVGKFDKKQLRAWMTEGTLSRQRAGELKRR
jgi:fatty-acyl-CoA synthase